MFTFNSLQLIALISNFFWPLVRILAFFSTAPIFNNKLINKKVKIILSVIISLLISPFLPTVHTTLFSFFGLFVLLQQILIGCVLGVSVQFLFSVINLSGEIMGLQMGLSFATFFNNSIHIGTSIVSRILNTLILFFSLTINFHLILISILVDSFYTVPIDNYFLHKNIFFVLLISFSHIFVDGMIFALPIIILLLSITFIMGLLNRLSPQISIFSIGFPLNLLVGMLVMHSLIPISLHFFNNLINKNIPFIYHVFDI